jgi:hypothetical protein
VTNPFEQAPQAPQQQPANPFGAGVPTAPAPAAPQQPAGNPFGQQAPQQPVAPQAYAPQQQYAPAPAAPQPSGQVFGVPYGQQPTAPQQYAPAPAAPQAAAPMAIDPNALGVAPPPPPAGDGKGAKLPDMYGRLVLIFPLGIETRNRNPQFITPEQRQRGQLTEECLTATVVVLDMGPGQGPGGFIDFGGAPYKMPPTPHTERAALPYVRRAMWITQSKLVGQLRTFLPQPGDTAPRMAAGRIVKAGPEANAAWYLQGADESELALCRQYLQLVADGRYPHPLASE